MEIRLYHDSHKIEYRSSFGAIPTESAITLRLGIIEGAAASGDCQAALRIWRSNDGERVMPMEREGNAFAVTVTAPDEGCLLWYYFIVTYEGNTWYYGNNADQLGGIGATYDHEPPSYQITVYDKRSKTPDWFKHAIVYQIFPDRFFRSTDSPACLQGKKGAVIHSCWDDPPNYCKDTKTGDVLQYDFFGGNLAGIKEKLGYLKDMGVTALYLNPVFESCSNHRYDTGDYHRIDPFLGTNEEFAALCAAARQQGIRIILDGVFSHTGADSLYFNKFGNYPTVGAYESKESPYYEWYRFTAYPDEYESWWGVKDLPNVEETTPSYMDFIINNDDSVLKFWLNQGISGWRLDVIDELPEKFLRRFYKVLKETDPEAVLIGEVWEDASNKVSYSEQRCYLSGYDIDSAMNYALRTTLIDFLLLRKDGRRMGAEIQHLVENYPKENFYAMLNLIGSHDVERILTTLAGDGNGNVAAYKEYAERRLRLLMAWQMTMPGAPCIYYGDEAGLEGGVDPANRGTYPWGHENEGLREWCRELTALRRKHVALQTGRFIPLYSDGDVYVYCRAVEGGKDVFGKAADDDFFIVALNRNVTSSRTISVYTDGLAYGNLQDVFEPRRVPLSTVNSRFSVHIAPLTAVVLRGKPAAKKRAGVLLHPTSLPSPYVAGDFGDAAYEFIDFLKASGQRVWQILPLTPPGPGNSPYVSSSAFAGNERLISLEKLVEWGVLDQAMYEKYASQMKAAKTVEELAELKLECLFAMARDKKLCISWQPYDNFCRENAYWLKDYCLYRAIRDFYNGRIWTTWPEDIRTRKARAMRHYQKELSATISTYSFLQSIFALQWRSIRDYAHQHGVSILGDVPIFVAHDSADCWAHQDLFDLDEKGNPAFCAGVPPDYFSINGQLWGNPLYRWDVMAEDHYDWWVKRFRQVSTLCDEVRIDHFRGFAAYWSVKAGADTAKEGSWQPGPGEDFFRVLFKQLRNLHLVAEDLGIITDDVCQLKDKLNLPGMKVLHFHMKERSDGMLSFDTEPNCLAYTGTHDNNTTRGWYEDELSPAQQQRLQAALGLDGTADVQAVVSKIIEYLYSRRAETAIVPMQDLLCLPGSCRMNCPGIAEGNWTWQMDEMPPAGLAERLAHLCAEVKR